MPRISQRVDQVSTGDVESVTAGDGLSGGGTSGALTIDLDPNSLTAATVAAGDKVVIADVDDSGNPKTVTAQAIADLAPVGDITAVTAGDGLTGGGTSGSVELALDRDLPTLEDTTTARTLALTDAGQLVRMNNAGATTVTVPPNSSVAFAVGAQVIVAAMGAGAVTVAAGAGVTLRSKDAALGVDGQYATASCVKIATDEWIVFGALA